jgi:hypothetical protein
MAMNLDALLRIKADVQGENNIRRLGSSMQSLQGQAKSAALGFNSLKGAVAGFGAAIAGSAIVGGLTAVVKKSIDAGDELFNLQAKTGVAANALIAIGNAAKLADVDTATLGKGLTKLSINLVKAAEGNDALARKFQALGVNVKGANGEVVPADQALKQIADRFADMPDGAGKAAAAVAVFGKAGADLIPLLNEGAAAMEKFTYKVGDDFAARSDLFNDTITEFGIKTQGFGLELTNALLPALQSILEVFGDLFDTKQDWTALFEVIKVGLRSVATVIYATIKLVDVAVKNVVAYLQAVGEALRGNFAGAADIVQNRVGGLLAQARQDFAQIQKLWSDSPSPGTGRRTGGQSMALDTSEADSKADAAARKAAAEAKRRAAEQERLEDRRANLTQKAIDLQRELFEAVQDVSAAEAGVGVTTIMGLSLERNDAIRESNRQVQDYLDNIAELKKQLEEVGGSLDTKPLYRLLDAFSLGSSAVAEKKYQQSLVELLPSLQDYNEQIREGTRLQENRKLGIEGLTEVQKLNLQIEMLGIEAVALTNPALAEQIRLLREKAGALDILNKKAKETTFEEGLKAQLQNVGQALGDTLMGAFDNLLDKTKSWKDFMVDALKQIGSLLLRAGLNMLAGPNGSGGFLSFLGFGFEKGGVMTNAGAAPLKRYSQGGVANRPQLALYGEGSKPEAYVPLPDGRRIPVALQGDKMRNAMGSGPMQGAGSPVLNMSFQSTNIGGVEYVSRDQLEAAMAATRRQASRDGAKRGMSMTLDRLQQSPSTRNRVGLR